MGAHSREKGKRAEMKHTHIYLSQNQCGHGMAKSSSKSSEWKGRQTDRQAGSSSKDIVIAPRSKN